MSCYWNVKMSRYWNVTLLECQNWKKRQKLKCKNVSLKTQKKIFFEQSARGRGGEKTREKDEEEEQKRGEKR